MIKRKSLCAVGFIILGITGCGPLNIPYINVYAARATYQTDGAIGLNGGNFTPSTKYNVGIFTNGAPRIIGTVTSDSAGNIDSSALEYACRTTLQVPLNVEVYIIKASGITGPGLAQSNTGSPDCW